MTEKENHLPNLSSEERAHALELAIQARRRYAALKARVRSLIKTRLEGIFVKSSKKLISSSQMMGTRGGGTSGSWFPGKPETPQKRHGKGCGGTPFSMPFLLSH